ncbi:UDP-4-amino-4,6-dideoxy-N-acetyl-beta-L-altrosamine transaminase [Marispirochaeta aestuarii]|uniref:UDP-4-amino-4, 6-dideoxy-N-acetyl-beta-L-altrosamine transaminase n=1 Tax=Marispirochaeta aestuarii TaxID=1963862 RepID=UPI0029C8FED1|nr:UDP-4-amino-4,6-dideoxy-N-acetyl-beta-L-altrosamine transaminase [Marispirochaeta aestuarii]
MNSFINYGRQWIDDNDVDEVIKALKSDYLTQGPAVEVFEDTICEYTGAKHCVAVSNATAGLHLAVRALGIEKDSEGITSPNTFVASSNALIYNELKPVFADIDAATYNIDPFKIKEKMSEKTKVIIPVHFAGRPCDMAAIRKLTEENKIHIIEDAAHAIGSAYENGQKVGSCVYSDMTVFSFHPVKTITTGEGGAVTTNDRDLYEKLKMLRSHGITRDASYLTSNPGPWYYEMHELGFNYRMTDIQAALGTAQMKKLESFKARRNYIIQRYNEAFSSLEHLQPPLADDGRSCFHLYVVKIDFKRLGKSRKSVMEALRSKKIGTQVHYIPVHTQPYYSKEYRYTYGDYPESEKYYESALSLPLYPSMTDADIERVISSIKELFV